MLVLPCADVPLLQTVKFLSAFEMEVGSLPTTNSHYPLLGQLFHLGNSLHTCVNCSRSLCWKDYDRQLAFFFFHLLPASFP